jgi:biotin synthase
MCYAIPGRVISIDGRYAIVDYFGERKRAINELVKVKVGDYIYAQGGYAIRIVPQKEAKEILITWKDVFFELQERDNRLSRINLEKKGVSKRTGLILDRALENLSLKKEDLLYLLNLKNKKETALLYKTANFIRQKHLKNSCCVHGIIEFSNCCKERCQYCGISCLNKRLRRYRMTKEEILECAHTAIEKYGFQALVLQSGEDTYYSVDDLCGIIKDIKKKNDVLIFISFGEIGIDGLKKLYEAGARGLLMRFETSSPKLYKEIHLGQKLESRLEHLKAANKLGYLIITGSLIGLPGQTKEILLNDILLAKKLNAEMYTFGPFIPHPDTPMGNCDPVTTDEILKVIAVTRLVDPENAKIVVTTGFETLDKKAREKGLMAGANSVMLNVTPDKYRHYYSIYPNRAHENESIEQQIDYTLKLLKKIGRAPTDLGI